MEIRMLRLHLYFIVIFLFFLFSCQRSQFATTTRTYKNGRVTYAKNYNYESRKSSIAISQKNQIKSVNKQLTLCLGSEKLMTAEIAIITPITEIQPGNLIASTSIEPIFTGVMKQNEHSNTIKRLVESGALHQDTIVKDNQMQAGQNEVHPADNRKVEKYGLSGFILSILGLFPLVGIPFAILGLVFGIKSLRKIHRNPTLYKGKGFAIASIILGVLGILVTLVFIGMFISLAIWSNSGT
jgi:uncharacterized membrane protein